MKKILYIVFLIISSPFVYISYFFGEPFKKTLELVKGAYKELEKKVEQLAVRSKTMSKEEAKEKAMKYFLDNIEGYDIPKNHIYIENAIDIAISETKKKVSDTIDENIQRHKQAQKEFNKDRQGENPIITTKITTLEQLKEKLNLEGK